ncbi:hypothetical protein [Pseudoalteromonas rhizosphaerae]|uniref:hypothetical protein n=1 Tax=Pseudoalteromonas rhizosphaerae TaxID=2518973 RepID=UPI003703E7D0
MHMFSHINVWPSLSLPKSLLEIDADAAAERLQIFERSSGTLIWHQRVSGKVSRILPVSYSLNASLMCIILDDNSEFNAAISDHVQAEQIDAVTLVL